MEFVKQLLNSKTIWGAIVSVASVAGMLFGVDISQELILELQSSLIGVTSSVGALVGTALTIWGRIKARGPITSAKPDVAVNVDEAQ